MPPLTHLGFTVCHLFSHSRNHNPSPSPYQSLVDSISEIMIPNQYFTVTFIVFAPTNPVYSVDEDEFFIDIEMFHSLEERIHPSLSFD